MRESLSQSFAHLPEVVTVVAVTEVTNTFLQGIFWVVSDAQANGNVLNVKMKANSFAVYRF